MSEASVSRVITVGNWSLHAEGDDTPRVLDLDLAERLGYERPRAIRDLIARLAEGGNLNDSAIRRIVRQTAAGGGRPATEYWLTEEQALFVTAKSETPKANAMLGEVIRVFTLARKGLLPSQQPAIDIDALALRVTEAVAKVVIPTVLQAVGRTVLHAPENKRDEAVAAVKEQIRIASCYRVQSGSAPNMKSARKSVENSLRERVGWWGRGARLTNFPSDLLERALRAAEAIVADERMRAENIHRASQLTLQIDVDANKPN